MQGPTIGSMTEAYLAQFVRNIVRQESVSASPDELLRLVKPTGRRVNFGTGTVAWPGGSTASSTLTVSHSLGKTPVVVLATVKDGTGLTLIPSVIARNYGASSFELVLTTVDGTTPANTVTTVVAWLAIA